MAQLNYACLLVPRFTIHYLTGDLADRMSEWIQNIQHRFGWRLDSWPCGPNICNGWSMSRQHFPRLFDAHHAPANFGKNLSRIPAFET